MSRPYRPARGGWTTPTDEDPFGELWLELPSSNSSGDDMPPLEPATPPPPSSPPHKKPHRTLVSPPPVLPLHVESKQAIEDAVNRRASIHLDHITDPLMRRMTEWKVKTEEEEDADETKEPYSIANYVSPSRSTEPKPRRSLATPLRMALDGKRHVYPKLPLKVTPTKRKK